MVTPDGEDAGWEHHAGRPVSEKQMQQRAGHRSHEPQRRSAQDQPPPGNPPGEVKQVRILPTSPCCRHCRQGVAGEDGEQGRDGISDPGDWRVRPRPRAAMKSSQEDHVQLGDSHKERRAGQHGQDRK